MLKNQRIAPRFAVMVVFSGRTKGLLIQALLTRSVVRPEAAFGRGVVEGDPIVDRGRPTAIQKRLQERQSSRSTTSVVARTSPQCVCPA